MFVTLHNSKIKLELEVKIGIENGNYFENIQNISFAYIFIWVRKLDSDSLTETKN
jgi:hypothetical protein